MATVKVFLNTRYKSKENTYPIVIRIIDKEKIFYHGIGYKVKEDQFKDGQVKKHEQAMLINSVINAKLNQARNYIAESKIRNKPIVLEHIFRHNVSFSFIEYLQHRARQYFDKGQVSMDFKVRRYAKELSKCFGELYFDQINQDHLRTFESFLIMGKNAANTRAKKFSWLRMFYDNAVTDGKATGINPFRSYKIALEPVKKEKLTLDNIKALEEIELNDGPINDARNLFLFSYYCKGQRFETCVTLKKGDIRSGRIHFRSNKGKKYLSVLLHQKLQKVLDFYKTQTDFLFPFIKVIETDPLKYRSQIGTQNFIVNRNLKKLAELCHIKIPLSMHIARYSVAFHLKQMDVSIYAIKDSLGHTSTRTTEIYLQSLDDEALDSEMRKLYGD